MKSRKVFGIASIILGIASIVVECLQAKSEHDDIVKEVRAQIIEELEYAGLIERD